MSSEATESVWDYPRPPRLERNSRSLRVEHGGEVVAQTVGGWRVLETSHPPAVGGWRVLETSHPPVFYFPRADVRWELFAPSEARGTLCEWKGAAQYVDLVVPGSPRVEAAGWIYPRPTARFQEISGALAIYASRVDACFVEDEQVEPQAGDFYGGWITHAIRGPFKGERGTAGW